MATGPLVGTSFAGYRVESVLGRGGMSVVYLAEHPRLKNRVALKLLAPALAQDDLFRERLVRESRLAASLNHPHVIPVFDTGEEDGTLFVSMRYVDGSDLRALLQDGPLPLEHTAAVISQAASALDAAHARGLVHRDVKPANILIETGGVPPGHVYVADFGLTKHTDARSGATTSGVVGTVDYMAPEQIEGRQVDGRADVYALGCVLYQCLTGKAPFDQPNDVAVLWAHIREDPPLPSTTDRGLRAFDGIVDRALAKDPRDRYESCGALADDVGRAAQVRKRPGRTRRARLPRPQRRTRRRWVVPALAGVVAGAAAAGAVALALRNDNPTPGVRTAAAPAADPILLGFVPPQLRPTCSRAAPPTPDFTSSVTCRPADPSVTSVRYSRAFTGARMRERFLQDVVSVGVIARGEPLLPTGSCPQAGGPAAREWVQLGRTRRLERFLSTPGVARGRLLCYTSPHDWSALEWTDTNNDVLSVAYGANRYALYRWWRVRGGLGG
jgi:tRNA A-37 threonylcarbamoyl transferase component Bud32